MLAACGLQRTQLPMVWQGDNLDGCGTISSIDTLPKDSPMRDIFAMNVAGSPLWIIPGVADGYAASMAAEWNHPGTTD